MKKLFFILTIFAFIFATAQPSFAGNCNNIKSSPAIEFTTSYGKLKYDNSKNNQQITAIAGRYGIVERGLFASGLATVNVNWEISINTLGKIMGDYDICVVPTSINVHIGFADPTIYISNQLEKNTCEYNVVKRHEQTHQQINKAALDYFLPLFQDAIRKIVANVKPHHVAHISEIDDATSKLTKTYNQKIAPLIEVFKNELLIEQGKLDNHNNYQFESKLCKGHY